MIADRSSGVVSQSFSMGVLALVPIRAEACLKLSALVILDRTAIFTSCALGTSVGSGSIQRELAVVFLA